MKHNNEIIKLKDKIAKEQKKRWYYNNELKKSRFDNDKLTSEYVILFNDSLNNDINQEETIRHLQEDNTIIQEELSKIMCSELDVTNENTRLKRGISIKGEQIANYQVNLKQKEQDLQWSQHLSKVLGFIILAFGTIIAINAVV